MMCLACKMFCFESQAILGSFIVLVIVFPPARTMETTVSVDCHSNPENMLVKVETDIPFQGLVYVSNHFGDYDCSTRGRKNTTTVLAVPFYGCNTTEKRPGLFMTKITVQQHHTIVSAGDGEYNVGCQMFRGDLQVGSNDLVDVKKAEKIEPLVTSPAPGPEVLLRIYDFENDLFVDTVRLGQVVELEVTVRDGRIYQGRLSDCDAYNDNGTNFPVIRDFCPVDLTISDKVYVDDQSRTTGDYYLYVPFKVFRFLDGSRVSFTCNVIVCQHDCPWADCGDYQGMSYGRKKRSTSTEGHLRMKVTSQVDVVDSDHRTPRASGQGIVEEEIVPPKNPPARKAEDTAKSKFSLPREYLIGGGTLAIALILSVCINIYLLIMIKKKLNDTSDTESSTSSVQEAPFFTRPSTSVSGRYDYLFESRCEPKHDWHSAYTPSRIDSQSNWNLLARRSERYDSKPEWQTGVTSSAWFIPSGKQDTREIVYPPMPIRHAKSTRRSHSFRY